MIVDFFSQFVRITCAMYFLDVGVTIMATVLEKGDVVLVLKQDLYQIVTEPLTRVLSVWLNLISQLPGLLLEIVKWLGRTIILGVCSLINVILPLVDVPIDQVKLALPVLFS